MSDEDEDEGDHMLSAARKGRGHHHEGVDESKGEGCVKSSSASCVDSRMNSPSSSSVEAKGSGGDGGGGERGEESGGVGGGAGRGAAGAGLQGRGPNGGDAGGMRLASAADLERVGFDWEAAMAAHERGEDTTEVHLRASPREFPPNQSISLTQNSKSKKQKVETSRSDD